MPRVPVEHWIAHHLRGDEECEGRERQIRLRKRRIVHQHRKKQCRDDNGWIEDVPQQRHRRRLGRATLDAVDATHRYRYAARVCRCANAFDVC
jgi:hypothetical protein